jgi:hypothetical protein
MSTVKHCTEMATDVAKLKANQSNHHDTIDRIWVAITELSDKIDNNMKDGENMRWKLAISLISTLFVSVVGLIIFIWDARDLIN